MPADVGMESRELVSRTEGSEDRVKVVAFEGFQASRLLQNAERARSYPKLWKVRKLPWKG